MVFRTFIFEDDPGARQLVSRVVKDRGHEVLEFSEPLACPVYAGTGCSCPRDRACGDILITDQQMPRMTGLELIEKMLRAGCRGAIRNKAVMSAGWRPEDLAKAKKLGCRVFHKPFRLSELEEWLAESEKRVPPGRRLVEIEHLR